MNVDELGLRSLTQLVELCQIQAAGGIETIDVKFDPQYIESLILFARAEIIKSAYTGNRGMASNHTIPSICIQDFYPVYDPDLQDGACWQKFYCPEVITLDDKFDGLRYVGTENDTTAFYRVKNASQYASMLNDPMLKRLIKQNVVYIYTATDNTLKLNDKDLKNFKVRGVFADPTIITSYSKENDPFPMGAESVNFMMSQIYNSFTRFASYTKGGEEAKGEDSTQLPQLSRQLMSLMIKESQSQGI